MAKDKKIVIIYHGGCRDGFGGAWAAWKKFGNKAVYLPAHDRFVLPREIKNKEVYLIDYTYEPDLVKKLLRDNKRVTAIDHHITAQKAARLTKEYSFSLRNSGAVLAWNYFHPGRKTPMLLRYIEDGDLWKWKIPRSREILTSTIDLTDFDFMEWSRLARELETPAKSKKYAEYGKLILRYERSIIEELLPGAELVKFANHKVFAVNAPHRFASDLGHILARKSHSLAIVWRKESGKIKVSLRSNGSINVGAIAKKYGGGGGHKAAAGFEWSSNVSLPWKPIKK
ncbi:MAG: hypothetical protein HY434_01445 [Candidatus Liptonbacteria bacterium]|nr:hypothetical protein [Candidatus Liptonbacteria bacterium]